MNYGILFRVVIFTVLIAAAWEYLTVIFPAWRRLKLQAARLDLTKAVAKLNEDALVTAKISDGEYLHDIFYKYLVMTLCGKNKLKFWMLLFANYNEKDEQAMQRFRKEVVGLDGETRAIVNGASLAAGKIIFLCSPIITILLVLKLMHDKKGLDAKKEKHLLKSHLKSQLIRSAEYYAVYSVQHRACLARA